MTTNLRDYFPLIRERNEILSEIYTKDKLKAMFHTWNEMQQKEFLDFCSGVRGIKFLYDPFFKEIMNVEYAPERLEDFLSQLLSKKVKIKMILPNDSTRIADEVSILVTDIVVELEDGSIANVEIQKVGYEFPGERCACYSADLLLRQYKRIRGRNNKKMCYRDVKTVYTIVLFEQSTSCFHQFKDCYIHHFEQTSDTGLKLELLQKYLFINLDIFKIIYHDKTVTNKLEAWLAFLCMDDPDVIARLITTYPEFKPIYEDAYRLCLNMEKIMGLFSEELLELDRNTVQYMMDEMKEEIDAGKRELETKRKELEASEKALSEKDSIISELRKRLAQYEKE